MELFKKYYQKITVLFKNGLTTFKNIKIKELLKNKKYRLYGSLFIIVILFIAINIFSNKRSEEKQVVVEESAQIEKLVEEFGRRQALVSLVTEKEERNRSISGHYSYYATNELIKSWQKDYENAPGRKTADPWPGRIEVDSVEEKDNSYVVLARLVELTSDSEYKDGVKAEYPLELKLVKVNNKWLISEYKKI